MIQMHDLNHYNTLDIDPQATAEEIKQAFRQLAKRYHPDKNPERQKFAERMFRRISIAYEVLRDPEQRLRYDLALRRYEVALKMAERHRKCQDAYLNRLRQSQQIRKKFELMFQELLHQNHTEGLHIYEQLKGDRRQFHIDDFLSYRDSRDCEFLIAEAYQKLGKNQKATEIYESLLLYEKRRPFFGHFAEEIRERLKQIYVNNLIQTTNLKNIPTDLKKIELLNLPKREIAWIYKKLAEVYSGINWISKAREMLQTAFELHPRMPGAKKICEKLNMEHLLSQNGKRHK